MDIFNSFIVNRYFAHRGLHDEKNPENSIGAFKRAIKAGYAIEFDVQQLADGTLVVFHDETLKRVTGESGYIKRLKKEDLKNYKLAGTEFTIPTLDEVLRLVNGRVPLLIEDKNFDDVGETERALLKALRAYSGEYAVQSFNPYVVHWFKENAPDVLRGQLAEFFKGERMPFARKFALKRMLFNKISQPHFISYNAKELPNRFVNKWKNLPVIGWIIGSPEEFMHAVKFCDNMIFEKFDINKMFAAKFE